MIKILDTSLRDGEQTEGINYSIDDKKKIAGKLERLGIPLIEAGYPASSGQEYQAVNAVAKALSESTVVALAGCKEGEIRSAGDAISPAKKKRIHVFVGTSDIHKEKKLRKSDADILEMIAAHVRMAKDYTPDVQFSTEDGTRTNMDFLNRSVICAIENGAGTINIPDTVGIAIPFTFSKRIDAIYRIPEIKDGKVTLSVHTHNDLGNAVANSIEAVLHGATQVEGTMLGIGERAGNMSLEAFIVAIDTQKRYFEMFEQGPFPALNGIRREMLYDTCRSLQRITKHPLAPNHPIIGQNVLKHVAGIHSDGVNKAKETYEIFDPEIYGIPRHQSMLGPKAGYSAIRARFEKIGFDISGIPKQALTQRYNSVADREGAVDDASLVMILRGEDKIPENYKIVSFTSGTSSQGGPYFLAKIYHNGDIMDIGSIGGTGQIDSMKKAITEHAGLCLEVIDYQRNSVDVDSKGSEGEAESVFVLENKGNVVRGLATDRDAFIADMKAYVTAVNRMAYLR